MIKTLCDNELNCIITIKGGPKRGQPKNDKTGCVYEFLANNSYYYKEVLAHVKACNKCNPVTVLERYLDYRIKNDKAVTRTLIDLVDKYVKLCVKKRITVPEELINSFYCRCLDYVVIVQRYTQFTIDDIITSVNTLLRYKSDHDIEMLRNYHIEYNVMFSLIENGISMPTNKQELNDLIAVYTIHDDYEYE